MGLLADFLGASDNFAPPRSAFAAAARPPQAPLGAKQLHPWVGVSAAMAESTLPRDRVLEILGLQPEPGAPKPQEPCQYSSALSFRNGD